MICFKIVFYRLFRKGVYLSWMAAHSNSDEQLRNLLRDIRIEKSLTQIELAKLVDQPQQVIRKIERWDRRLYATQLFEYVQSGFGIACGVR